MPAQAASEYSGYNLQYIRRLLVSGAIEGVKVGQVWLMKVSSLNEYLNSVRRARDRRFGQLQIIEWFVMRWQVEVTYAEARRHLGVETQRQWSDKAIACTTPALLGLFTWITLVAYRFHYSGIGS